MKELKLILSMVCLLTFGLTVNQANAQQTKGGTPPTFLVTEAQALPAQAYVKIPVNFSVTEWLREDSINATIGEIERPPFAREIPVDITMENSGVWTELPNGQRVWRLAVEAKNALALIIAYEEFYLPAGSRLFIYSADKTQVLGAYDNTSNSYGKQYSTPLVAGDVTVFEYVEPYEKTDDKARLRISGIGYAYNNVKIAKLPDAEVPEAGTPGGSHPTSPGSTYTCYVDIACSEGEGWREEAGSAACYMYTRISNASGTTKYWFYCSSALVNNTSNDKTPYIITAWHCGATYNYEATSPAEDFAMWQFYFFYENTACNVTGGYANNEMLTGATVVADPGGCTDGLLIKLVQPIPDEWITSGRIYFAGWDRRDVAPTSGVSINFPYAIPKKIATYTSPATVTGNVNYGYGGSCSSTMANGMWLAPFIRTTNGWGRSEGGASGGPLFNQNKRLVGTLCGAPTGQPNCSATSGNFNVRFAKLSYHWDKSGTTTATQMKTWLDPVGNGTADSCPPYPNDETPIVINPFGFNANRTDLYALESATFTITNSSTGDEAYTIDSVKWEFESGSPAVSTEQQPEIFYNTATGSPFNVKLLVYTKKPDTGIDTVFEVAKSDYINVTVKGGANAGVPVANLAVATVTADTLLEDNGYQRRIINAAGTAMGAWTNTSVSRTTTSSVYAKVRVSGTFSNNDVDNYSWQRYNGSETYSVSGYGYGGPPATGTNNNYFYQFLDWNSVRGTVRMYNRTAMNFSAFAGQTATLKFKFKNIIYTHSSGTKYYDGLQVQYSTNASSWTILKTIEQFTAETETSGTEGWIDVEVELPNLGSTYYIGFLSMGGDCAGAGAGDGMGIDNIEIVIKDVDEEPHVIIWEGDEVEFTDLSTGVPVLYEYEFPGGDPATSTTNAPKINVRYDNWGLYDIKQKVTNTFGSHDTVRTGYVEVKKLPIDPYDFKADTTYLYACESATFTISYKPKSEYAYVIDSVKWEFQGGTPAQSAEQQPVIAYNTATGSPFDVSLTVYATDTISGTDTVFIKQKTGYINVTIKGGASAGVPVANVAAVDFVTGTTKVVDDNGYQRSINGGAYTATTVSSTGTSSTYVKTLVSGTFSALANSSWTRTNRANSNTAGYSGYGYGGTTNNNDSYFYSFYDNNYEFGNVRMYNRAALDFGSISGATLKLKFKNVPSSGYWDGLAIQYCNTNPSAGTWTTIKIVEQSTSSAATSGTAGWIDVEVQLPNLSSTYYIGFMSMGEDCDGEGAGNGMGIDNIEIYGMDMQEKTHVILWEGENVDFYDLSTGVPVLYKYEFPDGDPATSTSDAPKINVRYNNAGLYNISQAVRNSFGADTMLREDYVEVVRRTLEADTSLIVADCSSEIDVHINLTANRNWTATFPSWVHVSPSSGTVAVEGIVENFDIHVTVPAQDKFVSNIGDIIFITDDQMATDTVTVRQASASPTGLTVVRQDDIDALVTWDEARCVIKEKEDSKCNIIDVGGGGFEEDTFQEWTTFTEGEGYGWEWSDYSDDIHSGGGAVASWSWYGAGEVFHVDNWLVSPKVRITEDYHTLTYYVQSLDDSPYDDYYEVRLSTASDITSVNDFDIVIRPLGPGGQASYSKVTINLSEYTGQDVYIAFHHYDYNKLALTIDDVSGLELASCLDTVVNDSERTQSLSKNSSSGRMLSINKARISRHEVYKERKKQQREITGREERKERMQNNENRPANINTLNETKLVGNSASQPENVLQAASAITGSDDLIKCGDYYSGTRFISQGYNVDGARAAVKFTKEELADYSCSGLTAITIAMYTPLDIDLFVQRGDDIIYTQHVPVSEITANAPTRIQLDSFVSFSGEGDLYIGYITPAYTSGYPYGTDNNPNVEGGAEIYYAGQWLSITNVGNFYIIGHTELEGMIGSYNLYRQRKLNGIFVDEPELLAGNLVTATYLDEDLPGGEYCYWVTLKSRTIESCPFDTVCVFIPYRQTLEPVADMEKIYGDDIFKLDKAGTDGIVIASTADDEDYFVGRTVPVKVEIISGNSIALTGSESDYTVKILTSGITQLRATQAGISGISDTLMPAKSVNFDVNVLKRDLFVSVADQTKLRGDAFDSFTLNYNRFYYEDDESDLDVPVTVTCSATPVSPAGDYAIVIHVGLDRNYTLIPQNGVLHLKDNTKVVNVFTPYDSNNSNDSFMPGFKVKIFSRLGVLIYETKNAQQKEYGWNGRFQDSEQFVNPGVYYYVLYDDNGKVIRTGSVNVVKE